MNIVSARFIASVYKAEQAPKPALPEIGFFGRSNVGKSTMINAIVNQKLARSSSTPGKTQCLNYYCVNDKFYLVDAPGYGYAKTSKRLQDSWQKNLEFWLTENKNLKLAVLLVDLKIPVQDSDIQMSEFLNYEKIPVLIVGNKNDKLKRSELTGQINVFKEQFSSFDFLSASGETKDGVSKLLQYMTSALKA